MIILAIDPGVEKMGFSIFDKQSNGKVKYSFIKSGLVKTARNLSHELRLHQIYKEIKVLVEQYNPSLIVMERLFFTNNQKTAIAVGQAQGVILLLSAESGIPTEYLTPNEIKAFVTGNGNADKKSVQKMLRLTMKEQLPETWEDDESDAIACGLAYCCINPSLVAASK